MTDQEGIYVDVDTMEVLRQIAGAETDDPQSLFAIANVSPADFLAFVREMKLSYDPRVREFLAAASLSTDFEEIKSPADDEHPDNPLTQREIEVLRQIALGLTRKEIALSLNIGIETLHEHINSLLRKLGTGNSMEATVRARRKRLI